MNYFGYIFAIKVTKLLFMLKRLLLSLLIFFITLPICYAQMNAITIVEDHRITTLVDKIMKSAKIIETPNDAPISKDSIIMKTVYRIQVLTTSDRSTVYTQKAALYQKFPKQKCYVVFKAPFFKLSLGNFPTSNAANQFKKQLKTSYPDALIVKDRIPTLIIKKPRPKASMQ
jgi:hypothetical protein